MGCKFTPALGMNFLDPATKKKHTMLKDDQGYLVADMHLPAALKVGPNQIFSTWAKFPAPPDSSKVVTVIIPRTNEPFEDVPISQ